jgi:hypothetical protein
LQENFTIERVYNVLSVCRFENFAIEYVTNSVRMLGGELPGIERGPLRNFRESIEVPCYQSHC